MEEQAQYNVAESKPVAVKRRWKFSALGIVRSIFEGLQWLTERFIALLRLLATLAIFLAVAFIIYNAFASRNTVVVKPFQVPVLMEQSNHAHAGRIVANVFKHHLLQTEERFQEELGRNSGRQGLVYTRAITSDQQLLVQGESIKLPETGISIENVIEFISGIFGRKNLNGAVYLEQDVNDPKLHKLYLQITLRGRIINFSEDELTTEKRRQLPPTNPTSLNLQLISAMLKSKSEEILSIASEDHNLYYYCTQATDNIEHKAGAHQQIFDYCSKLHARDATPQSLFELRNELGDISTSPSDDVITFPVMNYLLGEVEKKHANLCQAGNAIETPVCRSVSKQALIKATTVARAPRPPVVVTNSADSAAVVGAGSSSGDPLVNGSGVEPVAALTSSATSNTADSVSVETLQKACFPPTQGLSAKQVAAASFVAGVRDSKQSVKLEGDATQLLNNGLYQQALDSFQAAIEWDCSNAVAWANMGILFSTASLESDLRDAGQAELALTQAVLLKEDAGWMHHSLCLAQALSHDKELEQYLQNSSCKTARQLEPINEVLFDKLFHVEIAQRYRETDKLEKSLKAYQESMTGESKRGCHMKRAVQGMLLLNEQQVDGAKSALCEVLKAVPPSPDDAEIAACETEISELTKTVSCADS